MAFPVIVTIYEHVYRSDHLTTGWTRKLVRCGGFWVTELIYLAVRGMVLGTLIPTPLRGDFDRRGVLLNALRLAGEYVGELVWPFPLVAFPSFQRSVSFADRRVLFGIAVLIAVGAAFVLLWKCSRLYTFALFWIFVILAPALNVRYMGANVLAERYLYLPSVGFSWLLAGAIWWCWRRPYAWMRRLRWALGASAVIAALLAGRTIVARNHDWKDDRTLVVRTLEVRPDSPNMRNDLGLMKWYEGDHDEAERQWQLALSYKPDTVEVLANLGFARLEEKRYEEAISYLQRAIQLKPLFATPHIHLARVYAAEGRNADAENEFRRAVDIYSMNPDARKAWGQYYLDAGRLSDAERQFLVSVSVAPDLEAWSALGAIYDRQNATDKAEDAWRHVLSFESFNAQAHLSLGRIYLSKNRLAEAQEEFDACLLMDPANPEALAGRSKIRAIVSPSPPGSATQ
jgi:protein O-mannosyl-transferase